MSRFIANINSLEKLTFTSKVSDFAGDNQGQVRCFTQQCALPPIMVSQSLSATLSYELIECFGRCTGLQCLPTAMLIFCRHKYTLRGWLRSRCTISQYSRATFEGDYWMIQPIWNLLFDFAIVGYLSFWNDIGFLALPKCHGRQKVLGVALWIDHRMIADKIFACLHWQVVCYQILAVWLYLCYRLLWLLLLV